MNTKPLILAAIPFLLTSAMPSARANDAAAAVPTTNTLVIHADEGKNTISRNIYGQFSEHLGACIYGGVWVGEDSPIPNTRGIRNDVVAALKKIEIPVIRWPGGCFADQYHWMDGIGPRDQRPKRINTTWGGVVEDNQFGTHEFLDFCGQIGAAPYISGNVGSGTVEELAEWIEYMTAATNSVMSDLRRKDGREQPWKIPFVGIGNESWGCGGEMTPEFYSDNFRRYNTFVKDYPGNKIYRVASGSNGDDTNWTEVLMSDVGRRMNGLSLHYYTLPSGNDWKHKGSATEFNEAAWFATLKRALRMDDLVTRHSAIMDRYDPQKKVGLIVDEWGTWYDVRAGHEPRFSLPAKHAARRARCRRHPQYLQPALRPCENGLHRPARQCAPGDDPHRQRENDRHPELLGV